jgi:hypothetical protein
MGTCGCVTAEVDCQVSSAEGAAGVPMGGELANRGGLGCDPAHCNVGSFWAGIKVTAVSSAAGRTDETSAGARRPTIGVAPATQTARRLSRQTRTAIRGDLGDSEGTDPRA